MSSVQQISFVRHGQSVANVGGISVPHHAIELSAAGQQQALALASLLPAHPARVLASPYDRALATAQPYAQRWGVEVEVLDLLHELDAIAFALIEGMQGTERSALAATWWQAHDPDLRTGPEVETFHEFGARVAQFRQLWLPQLPHGTVCFGHGIWIAMLCWQTWDFAWQGAAGMQAFKRFQLGWPMPNGATYHLQRAGHGPWAVQADTAVMAHMRNVVAPAG